MVKKIALFIDGTWQKAVMGKKENTNVWKLYDATKKEDGKQVTKYLHGIGTTGPKYRHIVTAGTGRGTAWRIREAYAFLSSQYEKGDEIYLFGFSRGAFAARSLAGFVDAVGLLLRSYADHGDYIEQAYDLYESGISAENIPLASYLQQLSGKQGPSRGEDTSDQLPIYFIGVWDTVAALGLPLRLAKLTAKYTEYHRPQLPRNVTLARHALAIHELRPSYEPLLWTGWERGSPDPPPQTPKMMQVWFAGDHADVGGTWPDNAVLSEIALQWMAQEAQEAGLDILIEPNEPVVVEPKIHNNITGVVNRLPMPRVRNALQGNSNKIIKGDEANRKWPLAQSVVDSFSFHRSALRHLGTPFPAKDTGWLYRRYTKPKQHDADAAARQLFEGLGAGWGRAVPKKNMRPKILGSHGYNDSEAPPPWQRTEAARDWQADIDLYFAKPSVTPSSLNLRRAIRIGILTNPQKLLELLEQHLNNLDGRANALQLLAGLREALRAEALDDNDELSNLSTSLRVWERIQALTRKTPG